MSIGAKGAASAGLVEVELDGGNVVLTLHPPREKPVVLTMDPGEARALADGLMQAAEEAAEQAITKGIAGQVEVALCDGKRSSDDPNTCTRPHRPGVLYRHA